MSEATKQALEAAEKLSHDSVETVEPWITDCGGIQPKPLLPKEACVKGQ